MWTTSSHPNTSQQCVARQGELNDVAQEGIQLEEHWFRKAEQLQQELSEEAGLKMLGKLNQSSRTKQSHPLAVLHSFAI